MTNLDSKKAASDLAFSTVTNDGITTDAAVATKATALQLTDPQYQQFKRDVANFRQIYAAAVSQDTQAAARAALGQKPAPGTPTSDLRPPTPVSPVTGEAPAAQT